MEEVLDDKTAIRRGIVEIVISIKLGRVSEERLAAARRRIDEAVEILKAETMENASA